MQAMSIWEHKDSFRYKALVVDSVFETSCLYCSSKLDELKRDTSVPPGHRDGASLTGTVYRVCTCPVCGWWTALYTSVGSLSWAFSHYRSGAVGTLQNLDLTDISAPIDEVRCFLAAKFKSRFEMNPRLFEETVASVFQDIGYSARVTGYSRDGGIDIILDGPDNTLIGVQVKRYKRTIGVSQIRELTGALVIRGRYTGGVFVTTSRFSRDAQQEASQSTEKGYPIELLDAERFYEALKIAQRKRFVSQRDFLECIDKLYLHVLDDEYLMKPSEP